VFKMVKRWISRRDKGGKHGTGRYCEIPQ